MTTLSNICDRPFNHRASALFGRPNTSTHGSVLLMKMMLLNVRIDVHDLKSKRGYTSSHWLAEGYGR